MLRKYRRAKRIFAAAVMTSLLTGVYMVPAYADAEGPVVNITGVYDDGTLKLQGTNGIEYPSVITVGEIVSAGLTPGRIAGAVEGVIDIQGTAPVTVGKTKDDTTGQLTYTIGVETNGVIQAGDTGIVTGGTVFTEVNPGDGTFTYISAANTAGGNLAALDGAVTGLDAAVTDLDGAVSDLNIAVTDLDGAVSNLDITVTNLGGAVSDLNTAVADLDGTVSDLDAAMKKGITFNGDGGTSAGAIRFGETLAVSGGANITTTGTAGAITVDLNPALTGLESIETTDITVNNKLTAKDITVSNKLVTNDFEANGDTALNILRPAGAIIAERTPWPSGLSTARMNG